MQFPLLRQNIYKQSKNQGYFLPGQGPKLQDSVSTFSPWQLCPPYFGIGLSQYRCLRLIPAPHDTSHGDHFNQLLKPPFSLSVRYIRDEDN